MYQRTIFRDVIQAVQPNVPFEMDRFRLGFSKDLSLTNLLNALGTSESKRVIDFGEMTWQNVPAPPSPPCSSRSS